MFFRIPLSPPPLPPPSPPPPSPSHPPPPSPPLPPPPPPVPNAARVARPPRGAPRVWSERGPRIISRQPRYRRRRRRRGPNQLCRFRSHRRRPRHTRRRGARGCAWLGGAQRRGQARVVTAALEPETPLFAPLAEPFAHVTLRRRVAREHRRSECPFARQQWSTSLAQPAALRRLAESSERGPHPTEPAAASTPRRAWLRCLRGGTASAVAALAVCGRVKAREGRLALHWPAALEPRCLMGFPFFGFVLLLTYSNSISSAYSMQRRLIHALIPSTECVCVDTVP